MMHFLIDFSITDIPTAMRYTIIKVYTEVCFIYLALYIHIHTNIKKETKERLIA